MATTWMITVLTTGAGLALLLMMGTSLVVLGSHTASRMIDYLLGPR